MMKNILFVLFAIAISALVISIINISRDTVETIIVKYDDNVSSNNRIQSLSLLGIVSESPAKSKNKTVNVMHTKHKYHYTTDIHNTWTTTADWASGDNIVWIYKQSKAPTKKNEINLFAFPSTQPTHIKVTAVNRTAARAGHIVSHDVEWIVNDSSRELKVTLRGNGQSLWNAGDKISVGIELVWSQK